MNAKKVLTIGIDYRVVRGGVAAVENVYSTFYQPFNHVATTVPNGQVKKLLVLCKAILQFLYWMLFHPEIKSYMSRVLVMQVFGGKEYLFILLNGLIKKLFTICMEVALGIFQENIQRL